jgi:hypothetical protein
MKSGSRYPAPEIAVQPFAAGIKRVIRMSVTSEAGMKF